MIRKPYHLTSFERFVNYANGQLPYEHRGRLIKPKTRKKTPAREFYTASLPKLKKGYLELVSKYNKAVYVEQERVKDLDRVLSALTSDSRQYIYRILVGDEDFPHDSKFYKQFIKYEEEHDGWSRGWDDDEDEVDPLDFNLNRDQICALLGVPNASHRW